MIHPTANIYNNAIIPETTSVGAFCDIGSSLGIESKVQTGVSIPPGWKLGNRVFYGPGCRFANDRRPNIGKTFEPQPGSVEDGVVIGMGALIGPGVTLGKGCFIGMGAVVTKSVPPGETWVGCPAVPIEVNTNFPNKKLEREYDSEDANYICGLVDGEGYFSSQKNGEYTSFTFGMEMNYRDAETVKGLGEFFGCGNVYDRVRQTLVNKLRAHTISYQVRDTDSLVKIIIPFFDNFSLRGFKRIQYKRWRESLLKYKL